MRILHTPPVLPAGPRLMSHRRLLLLLALLTACELKEPPFFEPTQLDLSVFTGSVTGTVTVNGQGASGVTVTAGTRSVVTGADGSYLISGLLLGPNTVTIAGVPTIATCSQTTGSATVVSGGTTRLDFPCTAPTTGSVAGVVTVNGTGTAGVAVAVGARSTSTGAGGTYRIDGINPGSATAIVAPPSGATCSPSALQVTVAAGTVATANFACTAPTTGSLSGTVTINGTPTAGIGVSAGGSTATTGAGGVYRIDNLQPGTTQATLLSLPPNTTCNPSSQTVTIAAGQVASANFACTQPTFGSLAGTVTVNGVPVAGITITAGSRTATTGSSGTYRIDGLPSGATQVSIAGLPPSASCNLSSQTVTIAENQVATASFACTQPTTGSVTGVVTVNGLPAAGLTVVSGLASTTTASNGTYTLIGLLPGTVVVGISGLLPNVTCLPAVSQSVLIVAGATATANFTCTQTPPSFSLAVLPSYRHLGSTSEGCATVTTSPAQPNAAYTGLLTGPGVLTASLSGSLNSSGSALLRFGLNAYGTYNGSVTVLGNTANFSINVMIMPGSCPAP